MMSIARKVGIGAVRYNIVRVHPEKQLVFRWDEALNFDGNSGPTSNMCMQGPAAC